MARILLLPGSIWQYALGKKIKQMDHQLYVVSPEIDAPCKNIADKYMQSDIFAIDMIESFAKEQKIDAIISDECDIAMPVIAELGERLGLRTLSKDAASLYTNKFLMRVFAEKNDIKVPEYKLCKNICEAESFFLQIGKPIIIKPLDSNASHGVFVIKQLSDLYKHFEETMSFSRYDKKVLAERYIIGTEFTIDGIKTENTHYTLAISEKKHFIHDPIIANELYFTSFNSKYDYRRLKEINDRFVMQSTLEYGLTHAEYKYDGEDFYLIEIGARGGGNMISSVIAPYLSECDIYRYYINYALGDKSGDTIKGSYDNYNRAAVLKFFQAPNHGGKVKSITGLDILEKTHAIKAYGLNFAIGDTVGDCISDSARIGYYIACEESKEKLDQVINHIENSFYIEVE